MSSSETRPIRVILRADGSQNIGMGHVVRSLVLAQFLVDAGAWVRLIGQGVERAQKFANSFVSVPDEEAILDGSAEDARSVITLSPDVVVVDGYHFSRGFFEELDKHRIPFVVIDDNGETQATSPAIILNQNPHATPEMYLKKAENATLLLGPNFSLLRKEISELARANRRKSHITVTFGGTDVLSLTEPVSLALKAR